MLDIADKADNTAGSTGELTAAEYNDHKNCTQDSIEYSGQTLSGVKTPEQLGRAMFINGVAGQTFQDSAPDANTIQLTPLTGASGLRMTDDYTTLNGAIIEFFKTSANTSSTIVVNIGQTSGSLLGAKNLKSYDGSVPGVGTVQGYLRIQWDNANDYWVIIPNKELKKIKADSDADYTILDGDQFDIFEQIKTTSSGSNTHTLPTAADNKGRVLHFKLIQQSTGTGDYWIIDGEGAETIDGDTTFRLNGDGDYLTIYSNGTEWKILGFQASYVTNGDALIDRDDWTQTSPGSDTTLNASSAVNHDLNVSIDKLECKFFISTTGSDLFLVNDDCADNNNDAGYTIHEIDSNNLQIYTSTALHVITSSYTFLLINTQSYKYKIRVTRVR